MGASLLRTEVPVPIALLSTTQFTAFAQKMEKEGLTPVQIQRFEGDYTRFLQGRSGSISPWILEDSIGPVGSIPSLSELIGADASADAEILSKAVVLKLNGGLGTTMGLQGPKGVIPVKNGLSFLELAVRQLEVQVNAAAAAFPFC